MKKIMTSEYSDRLYHWSARILRHGMGPHREYLWLKSRIALPEKAQGQPVVIEACYHAIKEKLAATEAEYTRRNAKHGQIADYLSPICDQSLITGFNETLWYGTAEQVRVTVN